MAGATGVSLAAVIIAPTCAVSNSSTEQYMTWADTMTRNADVASSELDPAADDGADGSQSASWDPYHVWLTRVKQPRELVNHASTARNSNRAWNRPG